MGNGGYVCGIIAEAVDGPAQVSLRLPTPLDRSLSLESGEGWARLTDGGQLLGEGKVLDGGLEIQPPPSPSQSEIEEAKAFFPALGEHMAPHCFVCGNQRDPSDALCIFSGRHPASGHSLANWVPVTDLADQGGLVRPRFLWAALDCPSYFTLGQHDRIALLAQMSGAIARRPSAGEALTLRGWTLGHDGRKHHSASVIHDNEGMVIALAKALWVDVGAV